MPKRLTTSEFIQRAKKVQGNKYDYSRVEYINNRTKVIIGCKKHGDFEQAPERHLLGQGCYQCSGKIRLNYANFVERASKVHNDKYDYSKSKLKTVNDKTLIICTEHGDFSQNVKNHLNGQGCPECGVLESKRKQLDTKEDFIKKANDYHNNRYEYTFVDYVNSATLVKINCKEHGVFKMRPNNHLSGQGCPICGQIQAKTALTLDFNTFLNRAREVHGKNYSYDESSYGKYTSKIKIKCPHHGWFKQTPHSHISMKAGCPKCGKIKASNARKLSWNKVLELFRNVHGDAYEYSNENYVDVTTKIKIHCPKHGGFWQKPFAHYQGTGCPQCGIDKTQNKRRIDFEEFIARSRSVHGYRYDYSLAQFIDQSNPIKIICKKHGVFTQKARSHSRGRGCPTCNLSRGEEEIRLLLKKEGIQFEQQKLFEGLKDKGFLKCDFYLPDYNVVIEFNGRQHYEPVKAFGGKKGYEATLKRDRIKKEYLLDNGFHYLDINYKDGTLKKTIIEFLNSLQNI